MQPKLRNAIGTSTARRNRKLDRQRIISAAAFEALEKRQMFAVTASFSGGVVSVIGDALDNNITVSRDAAGTLLVNGGAVTIVGGTATVANTTTIQMFGQAGNDTLTLSEVNGALPNAVLFGGAGNDVLTGGSGADQLFGQAGNDTLLGKGNADLLFGGADNDVLTGGTGDDQSFGEAGDDGMIWNPGEGTDLNEGGDGIDTVEVNGGNGAEQFTVTANGTRVRFDRVSPAPFSIDIGTSEVLVTNMNGGDDTFTAGNGLSTLISITADGGTGNDTITGGDGADNLFGGDGNDLVTGGRGSDGAFLGAGDDTFVWNPGDGSDVVEGQAGNDTMLFNGANVNEHVDMSANGTRLRFTRDVAAITMDTNDVETVTFNALGGVDTITVGDLTGTSVTQVNLHLEATGGVGDGAADTVIVNANNADNSIQVVGAGTSYALSGLNTLVSVQGSEGANDALQVNTLGGNDTFTAAALPSDIVKLSVDAGTGNDNVIGSQGADMIIGGDDNDAINAGRGNDVALLGAGDDTFTWNPGDGSDVVEGQAGIDKMLFNGANIAENIDMSANGGRFRFTRDVANIVMDTDDVETVSFKALGGADNITVNDLTGTDVSSVQIDLASVPDGLTPDDAADSVIVNGTAGADAIHIANALGGTRVSGLAARVDIFRGSFQQDRLTVNGLAGADNIDASDTRTANLSLTLNGGAGDDVLFGSSASDAFNGGQGNDLVRMSNGDDTFTWNPGDGSDVVEGGAGADTMIFNGANINENINLSANGGRLRFTRDVAAITMDTDDVEKVSFQALGGVDNITIGDLSGTDVTNVSVKLEAAGGADDGSPDNVIVNGTNGSDVISAAGSAGNVQVSGLAATVSISGASAVTDRLTINALDGDDVVDGSGLTADAILFTANGGNGNDVLQGGAGNDILNGGDGDDVLVGGPGQDILDGGSGNNTLFQ